MEIGQKTTWTVSNSGRRPSLFLVATSAELQNKMWVQLALKRRLEALIR